MPYPIYVNQRPNPFLMQGMNLLQALALRKIDANLREKEVASAREYAEYRYNKEREDKLRTEGWTPSPPPQKELGDEAPDPNYVDVDGQTWKRPSVNTKELRTPQGPISLVMQGGRVLATMKPEAPKWKFSTRTFEKGGRLYQQKVWVNEQGQQMVPADAPYRAQTGTPSQASWQAKTRYWKDANGDILAQDYDFNPKTRERKLSGEPYKPVKGETMGLLQALIMGGQEVDVGSDGKVETSQSGYAGPGRYLHPELGEIQIESEEDYNKYME